MAYHKIFERFVTALSPEPTGLSPSGNPGSDIHALLFDVYGTLFISGSGDIGTAERQAFHARRIENVIREHDVGMSPEQLVHAFGQQVRARHEIMKKKGVDFPEIVIESVWKTILGWTDTDRVRKFAVAYELAVNPVAPMPGLAAMLKACRSMGRVMGIVSNAQFYTPCLFNYFCNAMPEKLGFNPDICIYSFKYGYAKPSPVLFHVAEARLARLGIRPENTLYIGNDMLNDIFPASTCGFRTALFAGDARSLRLRTDAPICRKHPPDMIITALNQIPDIVRVHP